MSFCQESRLHSYDFMRGVAIVGVILTHVAQNFSSGIQMLDHLLSFGRFGVQFFYFVSAFTMCYMWDLRQHETNPVIKFYIRRFFRIAPLFWLAILVYLLANGFQPNCWAPEGIGLKQILLSATFLHGFSPDAINSIVPGGWSIAIEMTFYMIFPVLAIKIRHRFGIYLLLGFFVYVFFMKDVLSSFFKAFYYTNSNAIVNDFLQLNFFNQFPVFMLGCFLFFVGSESKK